MRTLGRYGLLGLLLGVAVGLTLYFGFRSPPPERPAEIPAQPAPGTELEPRPTTPTTGAQSGCVTCHRTLRQTFIGHTFADWESSPHARQGIFCDNCHGGDSAQVEAGQAHRGLRSSRDPESPLYFTRIPATCGSCHTPELANFRESAHYRQLQETGRGPNCVTCHGAMAIAVLRPRELAATCAACHNERLGIRPDEPLKARFLLDLMVRAKDQLELVARLIALSKAVVDTSPAKTLLSQAQDELRLAQQTWHTFQLEGVEDRIERVFALAQAAVEALGAKEGS